MSIEQSMLRSQEAPVQASPTSYHGRSAALVSLRRVLGASLQAVALTGIFLIPTLFMHIGLCLVAPLSSGYMTGRLRRLSLEEAAAVGLILTLCVWVPLPVAQREFGFLSQLSSIAVIFLSGVVAVYYGALVGIAAWFGGHVIREEAPGDDRGITTDA
ncbi:MAG TPA: hypothetical protein VF201_16400 [Nitrolancea sp.]